MIVHYTTGLFISLVQGDVYKIFGLQGETYKNTSILLIKGDRLKVRLIMMSLLIIVGLLFTLSSVLAQESDVGLLANEQAEAIIIDPLIGTFQPIFQKMSLIVGGIFGLYLILILVRVYYERKKVKILKNIHSDLEKLTVHFGVPARHKTGFFHKIINSFKKEEDHKKKKS